MATLLEKNARVPDAITIAFLGDSITDDGTYIAFIDAYFRQHMPDKAIKLINLGVSSETASGLSETDHPFLRPCVHDRLIRALQESKPDWVVLGYGMNDGIYAPFGEERFLAYRDGILKAVEAVKRANAKAIVMTPPPFDPGSLDGAVLQPEDADDFSYKTPYAGYTDVLRRYTDWLLTLKAVTDAQINIYDPLFLHTEQARKHNPAYRSGDGIHPNPAGHWVIARTLLSGLFNITLKQVPDHVDNPDASPLFTLAMKRHRLLSGAWKEHVGHTNPNKAAAVGMASALGQADEIEAQIRRIAADLAEQPAVRSSVWKGYERHDFLLEGREGHIVLPKKAADGRPWVWRAEFFDAFAYVDMALLEQGWAIAYYGLSNMYGCPGAVELMNGFHRHVTTAYGLAPKTALFGFSRGGLYAFNYTAAHPENVALLYLDAPVLDIRSWPAGKGEGKGSPAEWEQCLAVYGITDEEAGSFRGSPLDNIEPVAAAGIPILIVAGDADEVVPLTENAALLEASYRQLGGTVAMIVKPGVGHHPHSLEDPKPIVDWIQAHNRL